MKRFLTNIILTLRSKFYHKINAIEKNEKRKR